MIQCWTILYSKSNSDVQRRGYVCETGETRDTHESSDTCETSETCEPVM